MTIELLAEIDILKTKLKEYKHIEEELGIDLITLFKALKNGVYYKEELTNRIVRLESFDLMIQAGAIQPKYKRLLLITLPLYFNDYGKAWALTKEELK